MPDNLTTGVFTLSLPGRSVPEAATVQRGARSLVGEAYLPGDNAVQGAAADAPDESEGAREQRSVTVSPPEPARAGVRG